MKWVWEGLLVLLGEENWLFGVFGWVVLEVPQ